MSTMSEVVKRARRMRRTPTPELAKAIRVSAGVTQAEMAAELGVHRVSVARWELGLRRPRGPLLDRYVEVLDELEALARG